MKLTAADGHAETELHSAAWNGDVQWANELIAKGANVNKCDSIGEIPLHGAAAFGNTEIVKLLLEHGSNYALISNESWVMRWTPPPNSGVNAPHLLGVDVSSFEQEASIMKVKLIGIDLAKNVGSSDKFVGSQQASWR